MELWVYKSGETGIHTYTNDPVKQEKYREQGYIVDTVENVMALILEVENKKWLSDPWKEITATFYEDKLCELPPAKWETVDNVTIFRCCEDLVWCSIAAHYAKYKGKHYWRYLRYPVDYTEVAKEVKEAYNASKHNA